jgi:hypothetical protein
MYIPDLFGGIKSEEAEVRTSQPCTRVYECDPCAAVWCVTIQFTNRAPPFFISAKLGAQDPLADTVLVEWDKLLGKTQISSTLFVGVILRLAMARAFGFSTFALWKSSPRVCWCIL